MRAVDEVRSDFNELVEEFNNAYKLVVGDLQKICVLYDEIASAYEMQDADTKEALRYFLEAVNVEKINWTMVSLKSILSKKLRDIGELSNESYDNMFQFEQYSDEYNEWLDLILEIGDTKEKLTKKMKKI